MNNSNEKNAWEHLCVSFNDKIIPVESVEYAEYIPEGSASKEDDILTFELTPIEMRMLKQNINLKYVDRGSFTCKTCKDDVYNFRLGTFEINTKLPPELDVKVGRNYKLNFILEEAAE